MLTVTLYGKTDCPLCEKALADLTELQGQFPHRVVEIDVEEEGLAEYVDKIPVIEIGPYQIKAPFDKQKIQITLGAAQDRLSQLEQIDQDAHQKRVQQGKTFTTGDKIFYWLSRRYMILLNLFAFVFVGLAFLAPILVSQGQNQPANLIYNVYSRLCHQLAYRSWFILGEQAAYPREIAAVGRFVTYEEATGLDPADVDAAIDFQGNSDLGYKLALCQRDIAIYGSILLFGLVFSLTGRKIPSLPFVAWVILGLGPIGLDGISQLVSQLPWDIVPVRESTPLLRTITGALFGFATAWFSYPVIEEAMSETRKVLSIKRSASQMNESSS